MIRVAAMVIIMSITTSIFAKDYGQVGPVYSIKEISFLDYIHSKLISMKNSGELGQVQKEFVDKVKNNADRPTGSILPKALKDSIRKYDPSVSVKNDIKNQDGILVAKAGTVVNPFDYIALSKEMVFINADNADELEFAAKKLKQNSLNKIILVSGGIKDTNIKLDHPVYFDQGARLVNKFDIKATPTVISQSGRMLLIKEVAL